MSSTINTNTNANEPTLRPDGSNVEYWQSRWEQQKTNWHKTECNKNLQDFLKVLPAPSSVMGKRRMFVPLAGKSVDLLYLVEMGYEVVALDAVEVATFQFFSDHRNVFPCYSVTKINDELIEYRTPNGLTYIVCDIFSPSFVRLYGGTFDAIWDRGSLVAIGADTRSRYVQLLVKLLKLNESSVKSPQILTETLTHHRGVVPPHCINEADFRKIYAEAIGLEGTEVVQCVNKEQKKEVWTDKPDVEIFAFTVDVRSKRHIS